MLKRVLILSASVGAGHIRAAQAIEKAFLELKATEEVRKAIEKVKDQVKSVR